MPKPAFLFSRVYRLAPQTWASRTLTSPGELTALNGLEMMPAGLTSGAIMIDVPGSVTFSGLRIHSGGKGESGDVIIDSGIRNFADSQGSGTITKILSLSRLAVAVTNLGRFRSSLLFSIIGLPWQESRLFVEDWMGLSFEIGTNGFFMEEDVLALPGGGSALRFPGNSTCKRPTLSARLAAWSTPLAAVLSQVVSLNKKKRQTYYGNRRKCEVLFSKYPEKENLDSY